MLDRTHGLEGPCYRAKTCLQLGLIGFVLMSFWSSKMLDRTHGLEGPCYEPKTQLPCFTYHFNVKSLLLLPLLVVGAFCIQGCSGPSVEGTWTMTPAEELPVKATFKTTFTKPDKATTVVLATSAVPGVGELKLQADVTGTWKLDGTKMSFTATDAQLKSSDGKELPGFMTDQIKDMIKDNLTKGSTGTLKWEGNDKFTVTLDSGKIATFERVKG